MSSLSYCTNCGAKLVEGNQNCPACLKSVALMIGAISSNSDRFGTGSEEPMATAIVIRELVAAKILTSAMPSAQIQNSSMLQSLVTSGRLARGLNTATRDNYPYIVAVIRVEPRDHSDVLSEYLAETSFKHHKSFSYGDLFVIVSTAGESPGDEFDELMTKLHEFLGSDSENGSELELADVEETTEDYTKPVPHTNESEELDSLELEPLAAPLMFEDAYSLLDWFAENGLVDDIDDMPGHLSHDEATLWSEGKLASFMILGTEDLQPLSVRVVIEASSNVAGVESFLSAEEVTASRSFEACDWHISLLALTPEDRPKLPRLESAIKDMLRPSN